MILGQSGRNRWQRLWRGDVVSLLLRQARHMDILVVADFDPSAQIKKEGIFFSTE